MMISTELQAIVDLMADFPAPWWVCGGWSIDLYLNRVTRSHKDVDVMILRPDQNLLHDYLQGWTLEAAIDGKLEPWPRGVYLELPVHILFCKNLSFTPDFLEILFNEADNQHFYFRRNRAIKRARPQAFLTTKSGVPILAPEIALLYKSKQPDSEDTPADFANTLPHLNRDQRDWLSAALRQQYGTHPWLDTIESTTT